MSLGDTSEIFNQGITYDDRGILDRDYSNFVLRITLLVHSENPEKSRATVPSCYLGSISIQYIDCLVIRLCIVARRFR